MSDRATGRDSDKFMLRFPEGMRARIREAAEANGRSMNSEIIARLEASFDPTRLHDDETKELVEGLIERAVQRLLTRAK